MTYAGAKENAEVLECFFGRLERELGELAPAVVKMMAEELGGCRLTFPDLGELERQQRDRLIRARFTGSNHQELALRFSLSERQIRNVLKK